MNFTNSSCTMFLANSICLGPVGATCCAATYFIWLMTPTHATILGKAITPQMVALGASAMSATQPMPMFSGSVLTSIKGAAIIHHDDGIVGGQCGWSALGSPNIVTKCTCAWVPALVMIDLAPTRRWQNKKVTDGAKQNWRAAGALRIVRFFLVYVD